mgnify:CR=1 FL=1
MPTDAPSPSIDPRRLDAALLHAGYATREAAAEALKVSPRTLARAVQARSRMGALALRALLGAERWRYVVGEVENLNA